MATPALEAMSSKEISVRHLKQAITAGEPMLLLDVRQPEEFAICRIDGAHLVPLPELPTRLEEVRHFAAGRPMVTFCHHGVRSLEAAAILRRGGVEWVRSLAGGIDAWAEEVEPGMARY